MVQEKLERGFNTHISGANEQRVNEQHRREKAELEKRRAQLARLERNRAKDPHKKSARRQWSEQVTAL